MLCIPYDEKRLTEGNAVEATTLRRGVRLSNEQGEAGVASARHFSNERNGQGRAQCNGERRQCE